MADHIVFNRPNKIAKYFAHDGTQWSFDASGDAWGDGNPADAPYGHDFPIPPGHYVLAQPQRFDAPDAPEGPGQIPVIDISSALRNALIDSGKAHSAGVMQDARERLDIGGIVLPIGSLAVFGRDGIMIHGGGSNLGEHADDPHQLLLKTFGCTRVHNEDWLTLADRVSAALQSGNNVIFTCVGDPAKVSD